MRLIGYRIEAVTAGLGWAAGHICKAVCPSPYLVIGSAKNDAILKICLA